MVACGGFSGVGISAVGGFGGVEEAGGHIVVDADACMGVEGGVVLLGRRKLRGFPVGELLAFGDTHAEENCVNPAQRVVGDSVVFNELLEVGESGGAEGGETVKAMEVIVD